MGGGFARAPPRSGPNNTHFGFSRKLPQDWPMDLDLRFEKLPDRPVTPQPVQVPLLATLVPSGLELSTVQVTV